MKKSLEYQLGYHICEYIICRYLPTLNIDLLKTRNVIEISEEETKKYEILDKKWFNKSFNKELDSTEEWNEKTLFWNEMVKKYIPEKLVCYVDNFDVDNIDEFKKGFSESLWNSDLSHYSTDVNDIIIEEIPEEYKEWYLRRKITLKRGD